MNRQRVIGPRGVGRHRLGGGKGELVGRALDEVLEGELVVALGAGGVQVILLGEDHFMGRGAGDNQLNIHVKPKDRLEGLLQQPEVAVTHNLADEIIAH